ncbi:MAG: UDP-glucose/GDP-mannose dehydrogenase family protein [Candidatus Moraniibacteriota bacterium]
MKVAFIGTGYVGLVTGTCMAEMGHEVICVDIDAKKIAGLKKGILPIYEPGLDVLVKKYYKQGTLAFTTSICDAVQSSEVVFSAVGTPEHKATGAADLQYVREVARQFGQHLNGYKVFVNKSTVPVGTGEEVRQIIATESGREYEFDVVSNPEFLREGSAVKDFLEPDRIAIGVENERARKVMEEVYEPLTSRGYPLFVTNIKSAEIIKYASNSFLATKISFINDIANICELVGADVKDVARGMGLDNRIGPKFLRAGVGYGGACFPKDVKALLTTSKDLKRPLRILEAVEAVNEDQKTIPFKVLKKHFKSLKGKTIAVWGLAFKPETDDVREAPSFVLLRSLAKAGAKIRAYDPVAIPNTKAYLGKLPVTYTKDAMLAVKGADAVVLLTEWKEFQSVDWGQVKRAMKGDFVFDGRNILPHAEIESLGLIYKGIGTR